MRADPALRDIPVVMISAARPARERGPLHRAGRGGLPAQAVRRPCCCARAWAPASRKSACATRTRCRLEARELAAWNQSSSSACASRWRSSSARRASSASSRPSSPSVIVAGGDEARWRATGARSPWSSSTCAGFTAFAETAEPEELMGVLAEYHAAMGRLILAHEGTLERFAGDGLMVFFNDPLPLPDPAARAVRMALAMREQVARAGRRLAEARLRPRCWASASRRAMPRSAPSASRGARLRRHRHGDQPRRAPVRGGRGGPGAGLPARGRRGRGPRRRRAGGPLTLKGFARPVPAFAVGERGLTA